MLPSTEHSAEFLPPLSATPSKEHRKTHGQGLLVYVTQKLAQRLLLEQ